MKELTIEEKAERYDKIIIEFKPIYDLAKEQGRIIDVEEFERIFPELKESEDERVRKALIEYFNEQCDMSDWNGVYGYQVVAWLEKQGKQKPADKVEPKFKVGDKIQYLKGCGTIMTIEKIENGEYIFDNNMGHTTIESGNKWHLVEQKLAWSEEDETKIKSIIAFLKSPSLCAMDGNKGIIDESIKYLNSLKDKVQPQPKQEWSEEDEAMWAEIADLLWEGYKQSGSKFSWNNIRNWVNPKLKSLRPQNTWKPSYEQMNKLCWIANQNKDNMIGKELMTLYNDLKKLKRE